MRIINNLSSFHIGLYDPELCCTGEAGTGKSFLLRIMIEFINRLPKSSGQELDKPVQITLAPTGVAAFIVHGTTIESGLGLQPNNRKSHISNNASRNADLQFLYQDLRVIFIDEISMVGSDQLARINFRLQEIMGNTKFFGGVACVCTGDFGQLPPVKQSMIWEPSHLDGRPNLAPNHWDEFFKIAYLRQKMRSEDSNFSIICDKVRIGTVDTHVSEFLKSCVRNCPFENNNEEYANGKLCIIVTNNKDRNRINADMLSKLLSDKKSFIVSALDSSTNVRNPPKLDENLPLTVTGQLEHTITFKEGAPVMITSNHQEKRYKNNGIVNGSRGYIDSIQPMKDKPDEPDIIWVRFHNDETGKLLRDDNRALLRHHRPNDPLAVPITRQRKPFQVKGNVSWLREQFPLTVCYSITCHKVIVFFTYVLF